MRFLALTFLIITSALLRQPNVADAQAQNLLKMSRIDLSQFFLNFNRFEDSLFDVVESLESVYFSRVNLTRGSLAALSLVGISQKVFGASSFIS